MLKTKIVTKKNGKTQKILKNLKTLSKNNLQVGHFKESGKHGNSDLTYPELLKIWELGLVQEGVIKNPLKQFYFDTISNNKFLKDPSVRTQYKKFLNGLLDPNASKVFIEEVGKVLRKEYSNVFGVTGRFMPPVGDNTTPMLDTGELKSATSYKTSFDKTVKEVG